MSQATRCGRSRPWKSMDGQREREGHEQTDEQPVDEVAPAEPVPEQHPGEGDGHDGAWLERASAAAWGGRLARASASRPPRR